jgi:hypothetical protein
MPPATSRSYSVTINDIPQEESEAKEYFLKYQAELAERFEHKQNVNYLIFQLEYASRYHLQGAVQFKNAVRLAGAKKFFHPHSPHLEACRSEQATIKYCAKEDTKIAGPWEMGTPPGGQGRKKELEACYEEFKKANYDLDVVAEKYPLQFLRYYKGFRELRLNRLRKTFPNDEKPEVYWYWGAAGTGKSYRCRQRAPDAYRLAPPIGTKNVYFYDYNGEPDHIFEDYDGYGGFRWLLVFLSEGRLLCNGCGVGVPVRRTRVFINSDRHPRDIFPNVFSEHPNLWAQLRRRITTIYHVQSFPTGSNNNAVHDPPQSDWESDEIV